jgi:beta-lactamase class A
MRSALKAGGSGILQNFSDGTSELSLRDLCVLMILLSDNTATNILIKRVSMDSVNAMLRGLGLEKTALNRVMMDAAASAQDRENISSPAEAARIMAILHEGTFVDRALSEEVLQLLSTGKGGSFERVFPDSVRVAWKPGGIAGVQTVWVLVRLPERPFAFAVMEKFDSAGEAGEIQQEIARVLFEYFWRLGNASRYGTFVDPALRSGAD